MNTFGRFFNNFHLSEAVLFRLIKVAIILLVGLIIAKILKNLAQNFTRKSKAFARSSFMPDLIFYTTLTVALIFALDCLNVDIKLLLGTAGFLTVALGFASQTSVSNIISGVFMMTERPFTIGDTVQIGDITGVVLSIDLLSTRMRTVDNLLVRIPNETLMKANIKNYTHFPLRRVDIPFKIGFKEPLSKIKTILFHLAAESPDIFDEPPPLFVAKEIQEWALEVQFSFWVKKGQHLEKKNDFIMRMLDAFQKYNVDMPVPRREVATYYNPETDEIK